MINSIYSRIISGVLATVLSTVVFAEYDTFFIEVSQGDTISQARLGIGETPSAANGEKVTSMLYLSYLQSDDIVKADNNNLGIQKVKIMGIGAGGFGYLDDPRKNGGAEFGFELVNTKFDDGAIDYDKSGIGFKTQLFIPLTGGFQTNIGVNLRPFFLSADWDDQSDLEVEYQAGLEYAFNWDIALYSHYRKLEIHTDDQTISFAEDVVFGLRARF
ncbi:MAG: hypothetical protein ACJA0E_000868 [Bermanella sp.]|jgi:hypothetical protein